MSLVRTFSKNDHHDQSCIKCELQFKIGDRVVSVAGRQYSKSKCRTRRYHTKCYTDAHGVPIYE